MMAIEAIAPARSGGSGTTVFCQMASTGHMGKPVSTLRRDGSALVAGFFALNDIEGRKYSR
jgi:hypothetical protein